MKVIKCPNCGSEKCQELTEEKWVCLACDNVFLVHNLSEEFRKTDKHISTMHQDLKMSLDKLLDGDTLNEASLLEKAENHLNKREYDLAYEFFSEIAKEFPQHAAGWYGKYKALTGNFSYVEKYARFVCDGNYINLEEGEEKVHFEGWKDIKNALSCEDADKEIIIGEVSRFLKKCSEYGKQDIEKSIVELKDMCLEKRKEKKEQEELFNKEKNKGKMKALIPAILIGGLLLVCIIYFFAAGDWLGKVIGIVAIVLVFKFGGRRLIDSIKDASEEGRAWNSTLTEVIGEIDDQLDEQGCALMCYCTDLDNYMQILKELEDGEKFVLKYTNNPMAGLCSYDDNVENTEKFISKFLDGKMERYAYLLKDDKK